MTAATDTLTSLVRRWWLTGVLAVLGGLVALVYASLSTPVYTATAHVIVIARSDGDSLAAVNYAQAYARVATQGQAVDAAVARGNGTATRDDLAGNVSVASSPDAPVVEITCTASSPDRAAELANLVAGGLVDSANRHTTQTRMSLALFNEATPPTRPTSPRPGLAVAVGTAIGLLLGGLAVLLGAGRDARTPGAAPAGPAAPTGHLDRVPEVDAARWTGRARVAINPPTPDPQPDVVQPAPPTPDLQRTENNDGRTSVGPDAA
jgi:capsular polysaccharide biosynthesis protein